MGFQKSHQIVLTSHFTKISSQQHVENNLLKDKNFKQES
jgi:hypothetical protein